MRKGWAVSVQVFLWHLVGLGLSGAGGQDVERLAGQLTADSYAEREAATRALCEAGLPALPLVTSAAVGDDPEAVARARIILEHFYDSLEPGMMEATRGGLLDLVESRDDEVAYRGGVLYRQVVEAARMRSRLHLKSLGQLETGKGPMESFRLGSGWEGGDEDLRHLLRFPEVSVVDVSHRTVADGFLAILPNLPRVEKLYIGHTSIVGPGLQHLADMPRLKYLSLQGLPVGDREAAAVAGIATLEHLGFDYTEVTDDGLVHVAELKHLQTLWLNGLGIAGPGLVHLQGLPKLNKLIFAKSCFGDDGMAFLSGLTSLEQLGLDDTQVSDAGIPHLASLTNLKKLWLNRTGLTDASIPALVKLTSLESLQVPGCNFTTEGIARLREALPACEITTE